MFAGAGSRRVLGPVCKCMRILFAGEVREGPLGGEEKHSVGLQASEHRDFGG